MDCDVIKDLIPLYKENLLSDASEKLVDEHLKTCKSCNEFLNELDNEIKNDKNESEPLNFLTHSLNKQKKTHGFIIASLLLSIFFILASYLTTPRQVQYKKGLVERTLTDKEVIFTFSDEVTRVYDDIGNLPDGGNIAFIDGSYTYLDRILGGKKASTSFKKDEVDVVSYNNNHGKAARVLYDPHYFMSNQGGSQLPRLIFGMYAALVLIGWVILFILTLLFRKKIGKYNLVRLNAIPFSYLLSTFLIKGKDLTSHHPVRDLVYILATALAIFLFIYSVTLYFKEKEKYKIL